MLTCGSAQAVNVFYAPVPDPDTNETHVLYLTNEHSKACQDPYFVTRLETVDGKPLKSQIVCWEFDIHTWMRIITADGEVINIMDITKVIPGSEGEANAIQNASLKRYQNMQMESANAILMEQKRKKDMVRSLENANIHR
ncbi:hypothetical protein EBAPG3_009360 [Nitrosospira lacus]|uniref:Uncharacterized protein n=2 Tax=Nitrosospira lacus TaxID=1288494 RepID=A0A1W6SQ84_9PROT|nr:hypothetical protein EBAPG3_009360 [Nitrosospira lacus]